jgi:repressor LexA
MEQRLTPRQIRILEWIEHYLSQHQTMPSRREIALGLGLSSPATIQQHIEALEAKGYLKRGEGRVSRSLHWTAKSKKHFLGQPHTEAGSSSTRDLDAIPLIGTIAAGYPIEVHPDPQFIKIPLDGWVSDTGALRNREELFMLSVRGDSMIEDGILPEDWVILKKASVARSGETVAALINGEATLKRLHHSKSGTELHPANPRYPIIHLRETDRFEIQGILVGLIRRFSRSNA